MKKSLIALLIFLIASPALAVPIVGEQVFLDGTGLEAKLRNSGGAMQFQNYGGTWDNIGASSLTDLDDLPGDDGDNDLIDGDLLNVGTTAGDANTLTLHDFLSGSITQDYCVSWNGTNWVMVTCGTGGALTDLDDLPGDDGDNDKIDGDLINFGTTAGDANTLTLHDFLSGSITQDYCVSWDGNNWVMVVCGTGGALTDLDDLPGDDGDNDKIDGDLINSGTTAGDANTLTLHDFIFGTITQGDCVSWNGTNWVVVPRGISNTNIVQIDGSPGSGKLAVFTAAGITGDTTPSANGLSLISAADYSAMRILLGLVIGTDVLAYQPIGIANGNLVEVDGTPIDGQFAVWTDNGLSGTDTLLNFKFPIPQYNIVIGSTDGTDAVDLSIAANTIIGRDGAGNIDDLSSDAIKRLHGGLRVEPLTLTTSGFDIETTDNKKVFALTIAGLTANRAGVLPAMTGSGNIYGFEIMDGDDTYDFQIDPDGTDQIIGTNAAGDYISMDDAGDYIEIVDIAVGKALIRNMRDGKLSDETERSSIVHKTWSFDPDAVCDGSVDRLFLMTVGDEAPKGIMIDEWKTSFQADPATEADLDLKRADAFIGVANAAVMDVLDTTAGVSSEDTDANINSGNAVANGKVIYLEFGTPYTETGQQIIFEMWYHAKEN